MVRKGLKRLIKVEHELSVCTKVESYYRIEGCKYDEKKKYAIVSGSEITLSSTCVGLNIILQYYSFYNKHDR